VIRTDVIRGDVIRTDVPVPTVVLVTDRAAVPPEELLARVRRAGLSGHGGRLGVMLRDPELSGARLLAWGREVAAAVREAGAQLYVNDRLDVARVLAADGVHLGRRSVTVADARAFLGASVRVSVSAHSVDEVSGAATAGADVVMLSPIFASPGKGTPLGLEALGAARRVLSSGAASGSAPALVALGGVDAARALACLRAGADGVAAIRADLGSTLGILLGR
jgi:thiamine-phosphate pyrophosphorylase